MLNYVDTFAQMLRAAGGQDLFGHVGKGKNAGAASPRGGAKGWLVCAGRFTGKARRLVGGRAMAAPACAVRMGGVPDAPGTSARLRAHMECAPTVWRASILLYIHTKNTPPGSVGLRAGWLWCLFTSDQTHKAGQTEGERRDIGDGQQGGNQCHKVGDQLGGHLLDGDMADAAADKQDRADRRGDVA